MFNFCINGMIMGVVSLGYKVREWKKGGIRIFMFVLVFL